MSEHKTGHSNWSAEQKARYWEEKEYKRTGKLGPILKAELAKAKKEFAERKKIEVKLEKEKARHAKRLAGNKA